MYCMSISVSRNTTDAVLKDNKNNSLILSKLDEKAEEKIVDSK